MHPGNGQLGAQVIKLPLVTLASHIKSGFQVPTGPFPFRLPGTWEAVGDG